MTPWPSHANRNPEAIRSRQRREDLYWMENVGNSASESDA